MTQEDKEILLKDLCARLPYGVKVKLGDNPNIFDLEYRIKFAIMYGDSDKLEDILDITNIKPYLFPFESMSEEATREFDATLEWITTADGYSESVMTYDSFDCLNKHHIDYRELIPKGLANDATGKNIY